MFFHVNFPLLANLYLICTLLSTIFSLGDFNSVYFVSRRRTGEFDARAGDARHPLRLRHGPAAARRGGGDLGAAAADPAGDHPDAQVPDLAGAAMTSTTFGEFGTSAADRSQSQSMRRIARRQRYLSNALAAVLSVVRADLDDPADLQHRHGLARGPQRCVHRQDLVRPSPSLEGYWVVFTQGYWYLENFWHQFGNSVYVGAATTFLTLAIASAGQLLDLADARPARLDGVERGTADLCDPGTRSWRSRSIGSCRTTA